MKPAILVFGEGVNDTKSVAGLAKIIRPDLEGVDILSRRDPVIHLKKSDLPKTRRSVSQAILKSVRAEGIRRNVIAVLAHQDADDVEPAHEIIANTIESELKALAVPHPVGVVPAWELEAWLMLFPQALSKTRACWRAVDIKDRNTGAISNAKEELRRMLRPTGKVNCPDYVESDSVSIVGRIDKNEYDLKSILLRSASFKRFHDKLAEVETK